MKYWLLTSEFPPFYGGGISTYCQQTAEMLANNGHEVTVFVYDKASKDTVIKSDSYRIVRFSPNQTFTKGYLGYSTQISYEYATVIKRYIEKEGAPDIIESQEYLGIAYYLLQFKWLGYEWIKNVPVVITAHSPAFLYLPHNHISTYKYPLFWIGEMERFCLQAADFVISPTQFLLDQINKDISINAPASVLANPFKPAISKEIVPEMGFSEEIVLLGKLSAQKGTFITLKNMEEAWKTRPNITLRLIGDQKIVYHPLGKTMADIVKSRYAQQISTGQLVLDAKIPPTQFIRKIGKAAMVIVPSTIDNLPYVVLEMMAMGKIVLASKQGGQSEIITHGMNGFLFDHEVEGDFIKQVLYIMTLADDQKRQIIENAQQLIHSRYSPTEIYRKKIRLLSQVKERQHLSTVFPLIRSKGEVVNYSGDEEKKGLLSIIITFYNSGEYLDGVLKNLSQVDYKEVEIIIVDDGSTDSDSLRRLAALIPGDTLKIIRHSNRGLAASRNEGARIAKGEFIAFLDADDLVKPDYYSKAISVLKKFRNIQFVGAWTRYFGKSNGIWPTFNPEPPIILYHNTINSAGIVFRRSAYLLSNGNDEQMPVKGLEDYDMIISMISNNMYGVVLPEALFEYRVRYNSMVRGITDYQKQLLTEYIRSKHQIIYSKYGVELLNLISQNGQSFKIDNPSLDYDFADKIPFGGKLAIRAASFVKRNKFLRPIAYKIYRLFN